MPVTVLVGVRRSRVDGGAKTAEDRLNGPLELVQVPVFSRRVDVVELLLVDTDEGEADALAMLPIPHLYVGALIAHLLAIITDDHPTTDDSAHALV